MEDYLVWLNMKSNNYFVGVDLCPFCCSMGDAFFGEWCPFQLAWVFRQKEETKGLDIMEGEKQESI